MNPIGQSSGFENDLTAEIEKQNLQSSDKCSSNSDAQFNLALMHYKGKGIDHNFSKAAEWFQKAAENGESSAQFNLALMYKKGEGVDIDLNKAAEWYTKAANLDHKKSQYELINHFLNGLGIEKDLNKATYWLLRHGLSSDKKSLKITGHRYSELIPLIPDILKSSKDFHEVVSMTFYKLPNELKGQMGAVFSKLIWSNIQLTELLAPGYKLNDEEAILIKQSVDLNPNLKEINFNLDNLDKKGNSFDKLKKNASKLIPKIFGPYTSSKTQLLDAAQQNKDILNLRTYLKNYLSSMEKPPRLAFDEMPSEVVTILAENMITASLKKGFSKAATYAALDEFLLSLQNNELQKN